MNITFLIGNGFDIAAGVHTSYTEFCDWYVEQRSDNIPVENLKHHIKQRKEEGDKYWSDFEVGLGQYTNNFTVKTVNDFIACFEDAQAKLIEYINLQTSLYDIQNIDEKQISKFSTGLVNYYSELSDIEIELFKQITDNDSKRNTSISFLSFNYTFLLKNIAEQLSKKPLKQWSSDSTHTLTVNPTITNIHGTLSHYPILGVNDESQIANKDLLSVPIFRETIIKPTSIEALGELWHRRALSIIDKSRIIGVFGTSMGVTDRKWWNKITDWLNSSDEHRLIIYWHADNDISNINYRQKLQEIRNAKETFLKHSQLPNNIKEKLSERIHVVVNVKNTFSITLTKKEPATV